MRTFIRLTAVATLLLLWQPGVRAQQSAGSSPSDRPVDTATKQQIIDGAIEHLKNAYIFADVAAST